MMDIEILRILNNFSNTPGIEEPLRYMLRTIKGNVDKTLDINGIRSEYPCYALDTGFAIEKSLVSSALCSTTTISYSPDAETTSLLKYLKTQYPGDVIAIKGSTEVFLRVNDGGEVELYMPTAIKWPFKNVKRLMVRKVTPAYFNTQLQDTTYPFLHTSTNALIVLRDDVIYCYTK